MFFLLKLMLIFGFPYSDNTKKDVYKSEASDGHFEYLELYYENDITSGIFYGFFTNDRNDLMFYKSSFKAEILSVGLLIFTISDFEYSRTPVTPHSQNVFINGKDLPVWVKGTSLRFRLEFCPCVISPFNKKDKQLKSGDLLVRRGEVYISNIYQEKIFHKEK